MNNDSRTSISHQPSFQT